MSQPARKRFGQHFLHDPNVIAKILAAIAPQATDHLVEIGGGHGALTLPLADRVARLDVIEIDRDLAAELERKTSASGHVHVHADDALRFDLRSLPVKDGRLRVVGNLPYNVSTPLLFRLLEFRDIIADINVMLQKEVVARMTASPGSRPSARMRKNERLRINGKNRTSRTRQDRAGGEVAAAEGARNQSSRQNKRLTNPRSRRNPGP